MANSHTKKSKKKLQEFKISVIALCVLACIPAMVKAEDDIQFNTDIMDVQDKQNIDVSQFSRRGYIMPGDYNFIIRVNQNALEEQPISFYAPDGDEKGSKACFVPELVQKLGFKEKYLKSFTLWHNNQCVDVTSLESVEAEADMGTSTLTLNVPQAYLEYSSENWVPSSMWENGIPGLLADYNFNALTSQGQGNNKTDRNSLSGNGTFGANFGPWRARADWQSNYQNDASNNEEGTQPAWTWNRFYLYRPLPRMGAKLTLGEDYLNSNIFDSLKFTGASLVSDDSMLPPNLRGYAPEVTGVAKTNAKVTVSQQGRVIYETQVASGPFAIQDLNSAVSGTLDVRVQEQDGSVQEYKVNTASIPYLTRPGSLRYKIYTGRPTNNDHSVEGEGFGSGEFSWGVSNGWSLYGGAIASKDYRSMAVGIGRDLMMLGALAFDVTRSDANLDGSSRKGQSYRVSYSKRFDETNSQVTFAGYRFSEKNFMSFNDFNAYKDAKTYGGFAGDNASENFQQSKEMYTITFNQQLEALNLSAYLNYSHQTYWNSPTEDRYSLSLSRYFDFGKMKNISASLTAYRNKFNGLKDDGAYLSISIPWGDSGNLSVYSSMSGSSNTQNIAYNDRLKNGDSYRVSAGGGDNGASVSGYYDHLADFAEITTNVDYQQNQYTSAGLSVRGGMTATMKGAALHRVGAAGETRVLVDTGDATGIPVQGYGNTMLTNRFGKAVISDVSSYNKTSLSIDINKLPDNAEASNSVLETTLTQGAIGYRKFDVISGLKAMAIIRLADGSFPPFGANVLNPDGQNVGIVDDGGNVWLSGIRAGISMDVKWGKDEHCTFTIPENVEKLNLENNLLLPCHR